MYYLYPGGISIRVFHKIAEVDNNGNSGITCFTTKTKKKIQQQNVTPVILEDLTLSSELLRHVLLKPSKIFVWSSSVSSNYCK